MTVSPLLRLTIGTGLALVGFTFLGNALAPLQEQEVLPAASGSGSLPPLPESPAAAAFASGDIKRAEVHLPVRDTVLSGTVLSPAEPGRYPGIVLVHGAGSGRRAGLIGTAEHFARAGMVALAYDKRTVGYSAVTHRDFGLLAEDALAAVALLRLRDDVDPTRISLWGISEGGWVVPIAAARAPDRVAFAILVSAPVVSPKEQLAWGVTTGLGRLGAPMGLRNAAATALSLGGFDYVDHDPLPALEQTTQPVLALYGTHDTAVPVVDSSRKLAAALEAGGNRAYTIRFFTAADHELRVGNGAFAPGYVQSMVRWVKGLPGTAHPPAGVQLAGETPVQRYKARALPPPQYVTGAALAVGFGLAAVGLLAGPVGTLVDRRRLPRAGESTGGAEVWHGVRQAVRWAAASAIATHVVFSLVLGGGIALALTHTGSPLIVNGGWLVARLAAVATVVLALASLDAVVSALRTGWKPTRVQVVSLAGSFGATGILLLIAAAWGLFACRW